MNHHEPVTPEALTIGDVLRRSAEHLGKKGAERPRLDAERLLGHVLGADRIELYMHLDRPLTRGELETARALVARRATGEPLQYVLGEWGFRRLTLTVDRRALIPRPETETVVDRCLALIDGAEAPRVLDVGTGSGAIALAIADEHPGARVTAVDRSPDALDLARENAAQAGLEIELLQVDLADGLPRGPFDVVVSNPPYVEAAELDALQPEVRNWEPREALVDDGQTTALAARARDILAPGGWLVLETHGERAGAVAESCARLGYDPTTIRPDLAGRGRVVEARWPTSTTQSQH